MCYIKKNFISFIFFLFLLVIWHPSLASASVLNNIAGNATEITINQQITDSIAYKGDCDWFKIQVNETSSLIHNLTNNSGGLYYEIYDSSLNLLKRNNTTGPGSATFSYKVGPGEYYIKISESGFPSINYQISNISLTVSIRNQDPYENNDVAGRAYAITPGQQINGIGIEATNDADWFKIQVNETSSLISNLTNNSGGLYYEIYDSSLNLLKRNTTNGSGSATFSYKVGPGEYYIKISESGFPSINYQISNISLNVNTVAETTITPAQTSEEVVFGNLITTGIKYKGDEHWYQVNTDHISSIVSELSTNNGYVNYTLYNSSLSQIYNKTFYSAGGKYSFKVEPGTYYIKLNESSGVNYSTHIVTLKVDLSKEYDFLLALGNPDWCGKVAEPVNIINGNYFSEDKDLSIPTQSVPLEFIRHYNSRNTDWGPLGKGWQHNYNTYLTINTDNSIAVTYGDGHSSLFTLVNVTDPKNHTLVQNTYDTNSKVIEQEDGKGQKSFMAYDPVLRKNTYTDALGYVTTYYYDDKYRQTKVEYPDGKYILYTYDSDYNKLGETDPRGNTTTYTYDSMGNMLTQKAPAPLSYITIYTYDSLNNPISITDVAGHITNFAYDTKGNLIRTSKTVEGQMAATSYTYDQYGQVNTITNANGKTSQVAYDPVWEPDSDY